MRIVLTVAAVSIFILTAPARDSRASTVLSPELFQEVSSGVALIHTYDCGGRPIELGTGFLVGSSVVMTARHVLEGACRVRVLVGGTQYTGLRWVSWRGGGSSVAASDLATIKLNQATTGDFVFRVRSSSPAAGSNLSMVGYPLGNRLSLNQGPIIWRGTVGGAPILAVRMLGAEGASGSPFLDDKGRVVGILQIGLGSKDVLGQRTSGVLEGLDLVRWWGPRARLDLCKSYPNGGIAGCRATTTTNPPTTTTASAFSPVSITSAWLSSDIAGTTHLAAFPSTTAVTVYLQATYASSSGPHVANTVWIDPNGQKELTTAFISLKYASGSVYQPAAFPAGTISGTWHADWYFDGKMVGDVAFVVD